MLIISMMFDNVKVCCGPRCTTFIINDNFYTYGNNDLVPTEQILSRRQIGEVCYGMYCTFLIEKSKKVIYSWGNNALGQLGLGDCYDIKMPQKIMFDFGSIITLVSSNGYRTMVVTKSAEIYGWGYNSYGELGLGDVQSRNFPHKLPLSNVKSTDCGHNHTIILTSEGCFGCGKNNYGQLGLENIQYQLSLKKILLPESNVIYVSCGWNHTVALVSNGNIYVWGSNDDGQLGLEDYQTRYTPQKINLAGSSITSRVVSIRCDSNYTLFLTKQGELFVRGSNEYGKIGPVTDLLVFRKIHLNEFILSVNCGYGHTIVTTKSGKYYGWGYNGNGELGLGDKTNRSEPTEIVIKTI